MEPGANRNDLGKLNDTMLDAMSMKLEELINTIHRSGGWWNYHFYCWWESWVGSGTCCQDENPTSCLLSSISCNVMLFSIPKLIQEKLIDFDGQLQMEGSHLVSTERGCLPVKISREDRILREDCGLGSSTKVSSLNRLLCEPLWLEFYPWKPQQWHPIPLLAIFCWPVS